MTFALPSRRAAVLAAPWVRNELWQRARAMPSLDLRFAESKSLIDAVSGRQLVDCTRTSDRSIITSAGVMDVIGSAAAGFTHDPFTFEPLGLFVEELRPNLLVNSAALATQSVTVAATVYTLSFYGSGDIVLTGAHSATVIGTGAFPNRRTLTFTPTAGTLGVTVSGTVEFANLEPGPRATSWIPTASSQATRSGEVVSIGGVNFSSWYRQDEGTLLIDSAIDYTVPAGRFPRVASLIGTPASNTIQCAFQTADNAGFEVTVAGSSQVGLSLPVDALRRRLAATYRTNDFAACVNGGAVSADTAGIVPIVNNLRIGDRFGNSTLNGTIRRLTYWPHRLDNNTLQELTR